jgi:hypothetical protein
MNADGSLPAPVTRTLPAGSAGSPAVSVVSGGTQASQAAQLARQVFVSAPVVIVAAQAPAPVQAALAAARAAHAPLLITPASASARTPAVIASLVAAVKGLNPQAVLVAGFPAAEIAGQLPGVSVVTTASQLPALARQPARCGAWPCSSRRSRPPAPARWPPRRWPSRR